MEYSGNFVIVVIYFFVSVDGILHERFSPVQPMTESVHSCFVGDKRYAEGERFMTEFRSCQCTRGNVVCTPFDLGSECL